MVYFLIYYSLGNDFNEEDEVEILRIFLLFVGF